MCSSAQSVSRPSSLLFFLRRPLTTFNTFQYSQIAFLSPTHRLHRPSAVHRYRIMQHTRFKCVEVTNPAVNFPVALMLNTTAPAPPFSTSALIPPPHHHHHYHHGMAPQSRRSEGEPLTTRLLRHLVEGERVVEGRVGEHASPVHPRPRVRSLQICHIG